MGKLRDIFFEKEKEEQPDVRYYGMLNDSVPIFTMNGRNVYASDLVQQAIYSQVKELKKLSPRHDMKKGRDIAPIDDEIQFVLENPNDFMTFTEFQERYYTSLLLNYNVFVYKQYVMNEDGNIELSALYPLNPNRVDFLEDSVGKMYVKLFFRNGLSYMIPRSRLIHDKIHAYENDVMGGNENGQPDLSSVTKTVGINDSLLESIRKSMNAGMAINGVVKYNTMVKPEAIEENIRKMEEQLKKNESGFLGIDLKGDFIQLKRDLQMVDKDTLDFVQDNILRHFGTPIEIIRGNATKEIYEGFYQTTLEHLIRSQSQIFTKELFTRKQRLLGHRINFYPDELIFMKTEQKIQLLQTVAPSGTMYENEKRVMFGMPPLPELVGVRLQSLNYISVDIAKEYQLQNNLKGGAENEK